TVFTVMPKCAATCFVAQPSQISSKTCNSRGVGRHHAGRCDAGIHCPFLLETPIGRAAQKHHMNRQQCTTVYVKRTPFIWMRFSERGHWELHALEGPRQLPESAPAPAAVTGFEGGEKRLRTDLGWRRGFFLMNQFAI